jgi:hypothetical protein
VLRAGRRFGKSTLGRHLLINEALKPAATGEPGVGCWVAPTYKYLLPQWREVCDVLAPVIVSKSEEEKHLRIRGGGMIDAWSADGGTPGEGRRYSLVIFDECAMLGADLEKLWTRSLRPTLADFAPNSSAWFLSTSKGANAYFNTLFSYGQGEREEWKSWQLGTVDNPFIPASEVESARRDLPAAAFLQEFMGDAVSFSGTVFTRLDDAIINQPLDTAEYTHGSARPWMRNVQLFLGADWSGAGRRAAGDWTAFVVIAFDSWGDRRSRTATVVAIERLKTSFALARTKLQGLVAQYAPAGITAELNSIGAAQVEALRAAGLRIHGWTATNATKHRLVENLALAFENGQIKIPDIPNRTELLAELMAYEAIPLQNGMTRFSAPPGGHDDLVMALMLAHWGGTMPVGGPRSAWVA